MYFPEVLTLIYALWFLLPLTHSTNEVTVQIKAVKKQKKKQNIKIKQLHYGGFEPSLFHLFVLC